MNQTEKLIRDHLKDLDKCNDKIRTVIDEAMYRLENAKSNFVKEFDETMRVLVEIRTVFKQVNKNGNENN